MPMVPSFVLKCQRYRMNSDGPHIRVGCPESQAIIGHKYILHFLSVPHYQAVGPLANESQILELDRIRAFCLRAVKAHNSRPLFDFNGCLL